MLMNDADEWCWWMVLMNDADECCLSKQEPRDRSVLFWKWQYFKTNSRNGAWGILLFGLSLKHDKMTVGGILMAHWVFWSTHERSWPSPQWLVVIMDHVLLRYWIMTLKLCTLQSSVLHTRLGCNTVTLSHNTIIAQQRHFRYHIICKKIVSMCFLWLLIRNVIGV